MDVNWNTEANRRYWFQPGYQLKYGKFQVKLKNKARCI